MPEIYRTPPAHKKVTQCVAFCLLALMLFFIGSCEKDEEVAQFDLNTTVSPSEGGTISISSGTFDSGEEVTLTATPSEGYVFINWSGAVTGDQNPIKVVFNADKNISANFEKMDSDADGVPDDIDLCDDTVSGQMVDAQGCSSAQKDSDGDGVTDDTDNCNDTPAGVIVDEEGCAEGVNNDSDGDGVTDSLDECPDTPNGETVDENGCSDGQRGDDSDGDGITDNLDECPETPSGEIVDESGCSDSQKDADNDGVPDSSDTCEATPEGETVDENGCSDSQKDSDGDGITDDLDECADTPMGETVDEKGCSADQKDTDGDGVPDLIDQCPETPEGEPVDDEGCSLVARTFVPDDNFEQQLIDLGYDDVLDDYVITENIIAVTNLGLNGVNSDVTDLTGLEDFVSLTSLFIANMTTTSIDLGNHPLLKRFNMNVSQVEELLADSHENIEEIGNNASRVANAIITDCPKLASMFMRESDYDNLVFTDNPLMIFLGGIDDAFFGTVRVENCSQFTGISGVRSLEIVNCESVTSIFYNPQAFASFGIQDITLRGNQNLTEIVVQNAGLNSLLISESDALSTITLENNPITSLDISTLPNLENLTVVENNLNCIQVNQSQLDAIPATWSVGAAVYSLDCDQ
ncbi:hypothetical protein FGM00_01365 [Aggregatimonas sangjinii]|uniref:Bacterial repeat domain-containing protein n=1 Tax=Aggregatimonas sangjinii TaxID=2583587 RepID=A0A5B7SPB3_9FLAO|nr:thrombospondin type 3 repeat-containing protein [Aggregatimonas sangjinii]QCW98832.1 hypothetical protein FGM00_01365 [Aggregatimonas sangjinii]